MLPIKHSVAVVITKQNRTLSVRRPENDDELPGIWGLPAGTCRGPETIEDVIQRIGREKLGVQLTPIRKIASGSQDRPAYRLEMELWEASMEGTPTHPEWQWTTPDLFGHLLEEGAAAGSLCCQLALKGESRVS